MGILYGIYGEDIRVIGGLYEDYILLSLGQGLIPGTHHQDQGFQFRGAIRVHGCGTVEEHVDSPVSYIGLV